jgi:hypothetical protein
LRSSGEETGIVREAVARLLVLAIAALTVLGAAGCEKRYTHPSQNLTVRLVSQPDGGLNLEVAYTVKNEGRKPLTFKFPSGKQFDAWCVVDGKEIARESRGKIYTQALTSLVLQPGESKVFTANLSIDPKLRQSMGATYELHAELVGQKDTELVLKAKAPGTGQVK